MANESRARMVWSEPWPDDCRRALSYAVVVPTIYGPMILHRYDDAQGVVCFRQGVSFAHREIRLLARVLQCFPENQVFLDIGANLGYFTIALAKLIGENGRIHAFEPQRIIFNMLAGSVALNCYSNVISYNVCVGDRAGKVEIPQFDYRSPMQFGSVEFGSEQKEPLAQQRQHDKSRLEYVPLITLDSLELQRADVIKIDVEGMELEVLRGAEETIRRCKPVIFIEYLKSGAHPLQDRLAELGYSSVDAGGYNFLAISNETIRNRALPTAEEMMIGVILAPKTAPEDFSRSLYLQLNPDVAAVGADPAEHYLQHGWLEGRRWS